MIYFLKANNRIKIGYTSDPSERMSSIQTSSPYDLEVLLIVDGNQDEERKLHARFSNLRRSGEWFHFGEPIMKYIENNTHRDRKYEFGLVSGDFEGYEQIRRLRNKHKISAAELGKRLSISQQAASAIELRERDGGVAIKTMQKIAEVLGYAFQYRFVQKKSMAQDED